MKTQKSIAGLTVRSNVKGGACTLSIADWNTAAMQCAGGDQGACDHLGREGCAENPLVCPTS